MERQNENMLGLLSAGFVGTAIGLLALSMADEGDTMKVLTAVLNTQFWLTTHVPITIGYGWCLVTSVLSRDACGTGHKQTGQTNSKKSNPFARNTGLNSPSVYRNRNHSRRNLGRPVMGRFWGWDPKENGALLIVLWLVWIIHGKIAGQFSPTTVTMGLSFLSVMVNFSMDRGQSFGCRPSFLRIYWEPVLGTRAFFTLLEMP